MSRVKALAEALEGSEIGELDLTEEGLRIRIRRQLAPVALVAQPTRRARRTEAAAPVEPGIAIVAPLTGVFYAASSPSTPSFAEVGDTVQAGQVVCIVEAMKVFNEIKTEIAGTVTAVVAKNGQLVQKGEALLRIQPM